MDRGENREPPQSDAVNATSRLEAFGRSDTFQHSFLAPEHHESNDHIALLYASSTEQFDTVAPFIQQGLQRNERCLYITDEHSRTELLEALRTREVDVDAALDSGALSVHTKQDTYLRDGTFTPEDMLAFLQDTVAEVVAEYDALRSTAEMTWALGATPDVEALIEYERELNHLYSELDTIGLCQYNLDRFPQSVIREIIRTHPHLVHDDWVSHNVYYTPPDQSSAPDTSSHEVARWMERLATLAEVETERSHQNERLRQFAHVISHDLRNPLNVAKGELDLAREAHESAHLDAVADAHDRMESMIENLLVSAQTGETRASDLEEIDLAEITTTCWQTVPTTEATLIIDTDRTILGDHDRIQHLFENLIRNAVEHGRDGVTVTVGDCACGFYIEDDGGGISHAERERVFESGYSTSEEGIGLGLAIVQDIVEGHGWEITVSESDDGGARFEITGVDRVRR